MADQGHDPLGESGIDTRIDTTVPHSARIWNYWLGGKDNYAVDRAAGEEWAAVAPQISVIAREVRAFLGRVVRFLAGEAGVRQFLDIGSGLPTADNTHQVAQRVAPGARVVYVDSDPLVLAHARALLVGAPRETTSYLHADLRDTAGLLEGASRLLDRDEPVAVLLLGVLGHIADVEQARAIVRHLMAEAAPGSYLAVCDGTPTDQKRRAGRAYADTGAVPYLPRPVHEMAGFFDGLRWIEPGLVPVSQWRPDPPARGVPAIGAAPPPVDEYGGVGRKPGP